MSTTALVTGGSKGIGFALAEELARRRYDLILVARNTNELEEAGAYLSENHETRVKLISEDLAEAEAPERLFQKTQSYHDDIEILINNAGFGGSGRFQENDPERQKSMIDVNVTSLTLLSRLFLPLLSERPRSYLLNVASTAAFQPGPGMALYYATKAFVVSLSEAIALEVEKQGVTVTTLCPGPTSTEFHQRAGTSGRIINHPFFSMRPEKVAKTGIRKMFKGKNLVIPGVMNKIGVWAVKVMPRPLIKRVVHYLHQTG